MTTIKLIGALLVTGALAISSFSYGGVQYDSESNTVRITSEILTGSGIGHITIYSERKITLTAGALSDDKKLISLCGIDPSLGILFLDNQMKIGGRPPSVSGTTDYNPVSKGGYVAAFEFEGDDALDLMDLLMEYEFVGFAISGSKCEEDSELSNAPLPVNFSARGIERAMSRIKKE
jgi:hypothetical protein